MVDLDVTRHTEQFDVILPVIAQPLHFFFRFSRFNRLDMMAIDTRRYVWYASFSNALTLASFTKSASV